MFYLLKKLLQMKILLNNKSLIEIIKKREKLGFVPTMGGIHEGHISLIKKSKKLCKKTIVSIFINPTQFNKKKDFVNYPKNIAKDIAILKKLKIHYLFIPKVNDIYKLNLKTKIKLLKKDLILCAKFRKGHFEGVLDVMDKLTKLINPNKIFMGEKDFQQQFLVKRFIEKKFNTKVIKCPTIRNKKKLALSSRNVLLDKKNLQIAAKITQDIFNFKKSLKNKKITFNVLQKKKKELNSIYNINIEYLDLRKTYSLISSTDVKKSRIFFAYYLNKVRLIDNL